MIQVLLVDDHPSVGEGTKSMIEQDSQIKVSVVLSALDALDIVQEQHFDVVLCDLNMPGISGLELTKRLLELDPHFKIVIYSGYEIGSHFNVLIEAGVSGFISKTMTQTRLIEAIYAAINGEAIIPIALLRQLRRLEVPLYQQGLRIEEKSINEKEMLILQEIAMGMSNKELSLLLHISQRSVEYQLTKIFEKLNVRSRGEAIREAKRLGIISLEQY